MAKFLRQPHFIVWDNGDLVTHEVMGGLKNVYAIGAGKIQSHNLVEPEHDYKVRREKHGVPLLLNIQHGYFI